MDKELKLQIIRVSDDVKFPQRANSTDSGLDVFAWKFKKIYYGREENVLNIEDKKSIILYSLDRVLIDTGLKLTVAPGYEVQVRPKSGRSLKEGLTVLNSPGTVDHMYSETVCVILVNLSNKVKKIELGEKIAQLVIQKVELLDVIEVKELNNGVRSGFGSTGI